MSKGRPTITTNGAIIWRETIATASHKLLSEVLAWEHLPEGAAGDIKRAVVHAEKAARTSYDNFERTFWLSSLGNLLARKYERTGALGDLQHAIMRTEEALDTMPSGHPDRPARLNNLGNCLGRRFELTGTIDDLEKAILHCGTAVELTPRFHPYQASRLSSLGNWLVRRYERTGNIENLEQAINRTQEAMELTTPNQLSRAAYTTSLGIMLALRYRQSKSPTDIWQAVSFAELAIMSTSTDSPNRANWLSNLGSILAVQYEETRSLNDLQYAIYCLKQALEEMPDYHPNRAASLNSLGDMIRYRYDQTQTTEDYWDCVSCFENSWACINAPPTVRIRAAYKAAKILLVHQNWERSSVLLNQALHLLPRVSSRISSRCDQLYMIREFAGLATLAASTSLLRSNGTLNALKLLEIGRGVISRLRFGPQVDLSCQQEPYQEAERKIYLCQSYPRTSIIPSSTFAQGNTVVTKHFKLSECYTALQCEGDIDEVDKSPDFGNSLYSPTEHELRAAASGGPVVVINVSPLRCDAILLEPNEIRSMLLPDLHHKDIVQNVELLKSTHTSLEGLPQAKKETEQILEWLWVTVTSPILHELGFKGPPADGKWPHVWWVPTGLLSLLPLHAAGRHDSTSFETVIDRVVSSYSPSVKALLCAQRRSLALCHVPKKIFLVSMEVTPCCLSLDTAREETMVVEELMPKLSKTRLENPCKKDVINGLQNCDIFHFAGHSMSDSEDPSRSRLLLSDWQENPLTAEDLLDLKLHDSQPFIAYLSACSTGANSAEQLQDESINLMTACQLAGFRHVVGSLWDVYDMYSIDAAKEFYRVLEGAREVSDEAVAWGVHMAARHIRQITRDQGNAAFGAGNPLAWAAYIHIGP
ncbi:CHAT domain-containing protein [Hypomontagnella monticulosa]|nr:CHAT domain-containing protein [Hypomontagnella monticulosa]